jgi:hypothetical protein
MKCREWIVVIKIRDEIELKNKEEFASAHEIRDYSTYLSDAPAGISSRILSVSRCEHPRARKLFDDLSR